jgi:hypothetical protein
MAACKALISSVGPVMREWAEVRGRVLGVQAPSPQLQTQGSVSSPLHVDLPVGRDGDWHEGEGWDVVGGV